METNLPDDQVAFIRDLVLKGRFSTPDEAISEAIRLLMSREALKRSIAVGIEQADRGEVVDHDTVFGELRLIAASKSTAD